MATSEHSRSLSEPCAHDPCLLKLVFTYVQREALLRMKRMNAANAKPSHPMSDIHVRRLFSRLQFCHADAVIGVCIMVLETFCRGLAIFVTTASRQAPR